MPGQRRKIDDPEFEAEYTPAPEVPQEWLRLVHKLNPITAIVVWEVLTGSLSPATISLARLSPDWDRYTTIRIVGGGNAKYCREVAELAHEDLDEIFLDVMPDYQSRQIWQ